MGMSEKLGEGFRDPKRCDSFILLNHLFIGLPLIFGGEDDGSNFPFINALISETSAGLRCRT